MKQVFTNSLRLAMVLLLAAVPAMAQGPSNDELLVAISKQLSPEAQSALDAELFDYHVFELDLDKLNGRVRKDGRLNLHLGNKTFELRLEENNLRGQGYRRAALSADGVELVDPGPITTFRGTIAGDSESVVRLSVTPDLFSGFIYSGGEMLFVDPVSDFTRGLKLPKAAAPGRGDVVVYLEKNHRGNPAGSCGVPGHKGLGPDHAHLSGQRGDLLDNLGLSEVTKTHQFRTFEIALECDGQYHSIYGLNGGVNRMEGIMNDVDGFIYVSELNLGINVVFSGCWTSISGDPYTSLNASTTLNQMANWWAANGDGLAPSRDATHQFSGKDFSGSTIGIAFVGVICTNPDLSVGISQDISSSAGRRRLTAHELGHNLSANHDSGVNCSGNGPIMCPSIQTGGSSAADDFSNASLNSIDNHIDSFGSCI